MHKPDHVKSNPGFQRAVFRNSAYSSKGKLNPFHGANITSFSSRNMNTLSNAPPPVSYKEDPRSREASLQSTAATSTSFTDTLIRRNRHRSIPPRFEHRLQPNIEKSIRQPPPEQAWRTVTDRTRSNSYDTHSQQKRVVAHQGLRTADLNNRLMRYAKRETFLHRRSIPNPKSGKPYIRRNLGRTYVKDRLCLPPEPDRIVKRHDSFNDNEIIPISDAKEIHVRSNIQNDPRIRSSEEMTPERERESRDFNSDPFFNSPSTSPIKAHSKCDQFFDEDSQLKQISTADSQHNFDVPPPPPPPPPPPLPRPNGSLTDTKQQVIQIHDEAEKDHGNDVQSFWDRTEQASSEIVFPPARIVDRAEEPSISNVGSFFDDEIPTTHEFSSKSHLHRPHHSKQDREHRKSEHAQDKLKRYKRKVSPTPVKMPHLKRSPKKVKYHPHPPHPSPSKPRPKGDKNSPSALVDHSNAGILKLNTKSHTHIRVKKTVNLADKESEHSSSDECTDQPESRKLVIPLPNSPLQALEVITGGEEQVATSVSTKTNSTSAQHNRQIENVPGKEIGQSADTSGPAVNSSRQGMEQPVYSLDEFLTLRNHSISESSDIGLHIEFVDDIPANPPPKKHSQARMNADISPPPTSNGMDLLNIHSYKPISPKSDLETPDSVFTPGFNTSQQDHTLFPKGARSSSLHSTEYANAVHSTNSNDTLLCESDCKHVSKHRSVKSRRSGRKCNKQLRKANSDNSLCRPDGETSITSNKKEVSIPLTKLDMTQYGAKVKCTSQVPEHIKEKQVVKVFSQWKCMFCHRGANENNLGYLYGPYFKTGENLNITPQPVSARKKASRDSDENEMWVHAPCALWSPGVFLVSFHLRGLVEAFESSQSMKCTDCGHSGATLHCEREGCTTVYHYSCAEINKCRFNHDCFKLQCPKHDSNLSNSHSQES